MDKLFHKKSGKFDELFEWFKNFTHVKQFIKQTGKTKDDDLWEMVIILNRKALQYAN